MENINKRKWIGKLFFIGTPAYFMCTVLHLCMDGHLAHPPYPAWHWIGEGVWIGCYLSISVLSLITKMKEKLLFSIGGTFILCSRLLLGSGAGFLAIIEFLLIIFLTIASIKYLRQKKKHRQKIKVDHYPELNDTDGSFHSES